MFFMFFQGFAEDKDIVQIDNDDFIDVFFQYMIDYNLECYWCINKFK